MNTETPTPEDSAGTDATPSTPSFGAEASQNGSVTPAEPGGTAWPSIDPPGGQYATGHLPTATEAVWEAPLPVDPTPSRGRQATIGLIVAVVVAVLGFPLGWLWNSVAPWLPAQLDGGDLIYADPEGEQRAGQEVWFILLSLGLGIVIAIVAWLALRRYRGSIMLIALVIGSTATGWIAWWTGRHIGRSHALNLAAHAKNGAIIMLPPDLRIKSPGNVAHWHGIPYLGGDILYVAVAALVTYLLIVGFSSSPSLGMRRPPR